MIHADVLIIGSGISGLSYALKVATSCPRSKIIVITKSDEEESSTKYAQGGVAVVFDTSKDSLEKHVADTLRAGDGLCNEQVVKMVVKEGPTRIKEIIEWGAKFDKNVSKEYDLGREGGHTENRIIHHKDKTGAEIERALLAKIEQMSNVELRSYYYASDLIMDAHNTTCCGASVLDIKQMQIVNIYSKITLLATGGCGHVYKNTTNPPIATGDGIALAQRAGGKVSNMQFIQFHPTAFYRSGDGQLPLISEAMRGAGAKLLNSAQERFMHKYDAREEMASRDIVSLAIDKEMKATGKQYLYLDCRHIDHQMIANHFPNIYKQCKEQGVDMFTQLVPIVPACHYLCGGIDVDNMGQTSIANLFAVGECSNTGLHGANRLASNSLLEAIVYAHRAALSTIDKLNTKQWNAPMEHQNNFGLPKSIDNKEIAAMKMELQTLMSRYVSIVRSYDELAIAKKQQESLSDRLNALQADKAPNAELQELRNLLCVASLIIQQSLEQKENRGTFYNINLDENN